MFKNLAILTFVLALMILPSDNLAEEFKRGIVSKYGKDQFYQNRGDETINRNIRRAFPENSESFKRYRDKKQQFREQFKNLSPEEKRQKFKEIKMQQMQRRMNNIGNLDPDAAARMKKISQELEALPKEQRREKMKELRKEFKGLREKRRERFEKRWNESSEEQKKTFCERVEKRCYEDQKMIACKVLDNKCGG